MNLNNQSRDLSPTRRYPFAHQDHRYNNSARHFDGRREVYSSLGDYRHDYLLNPRGGRRNVYSSLGDYGNNYTESQNRFYPGYRNSGNYQRNSGLDLRWKNWTEQIIWKKTFFTTNFKTIIFFFYWKTNFLNEQFDEIDEIWPIILRTHKINFLTRQSLPAAWVSHIKQIS